MSVIGCPHCGGEIELSPPRIRLQPFLPIESLNLGIRATNALYRQGIYLIQDLIAYSADELLALEGVGAGSIATIRTALAGSGMALRQKDPRFDQ